MGEQVAAGSHGGVAQLGEHLPCKQGVKGSNPSTSIVSVHYRHNVCTCTMHFAAKLLSRVQARYTVKFHSANESELSTPMKFACALYLENRILNRKS